MAKDRLHALEFVKLAQLDLLAQAGGHVAGPRVHFCIKARFEEVVALRGLSAKLDFYSQNFVFCLLEKCLHIVGLVIL